MVLAYAAVKRYPDQIYSTIRCAGFAATRACAPARKRVSGAPCIRDASRKRVLHWCANTAPPLRGGAPRDRLKDAWLNPNLTPHFKKSKSVYYV